jgi:5'-3' exonuclease, N-terminal resolvase-like domain
MGKNQTSRDIPRRPLLVINGDSFAHRAYHALPKTILRRGRKPAAAILGFANMLLRLHREEQPRAVLVAWAQQGRQGFYAEVKLSGFFFSGTRAVGPTARGERSAAKTISAVVARGRARRI